MASSVTSSSSIHLGRLHAALQEFKNVSDELPVQAMETFLVVASHDPEPYPMERLIDVIGYSSATSSRNVSRFMSSTWTRKQGPGWIKAEINDDDRRRKLLSLTPKGRAAVHRIVKALGG